MRKPRSTPTYLPPPTFTAPASLLPFALFPRALSLHGPVVHLPPLPPFPLTAAPTAQGAHSVSLPHPSRPPIRLYFRRASVRDAFLHHALTAISRLSKGLSDYTLLRPLGHGATSFVRLVRCRSDAALYALKALPKADVLASPNRVAHVLEERRALARAARSHTVFVSPLVDAFETRTHLCLVTPVARYGDLAAVLAQLDGNKLPEDVAKAVFAEIVLALEELHGMGYLYRDMKLDNLLLSASGHIRLADLGLVKRLPVSRCGSECSGFGDMARPSVSSEGCVSDRAESVLSCCSSEDGDSPVRLVGRTHSFVGTRRYFSPEHLRGRHKSKGGYGAPADVWALGVVLYVMATGEFPFGKGVSKRNSKGMFDAIRHEEIRYPAHMDAGLKTLLQGLLERDVAKRLTIAGIKTQSWFAGTDWDRVRARAAMDAPREKVVALLQKQGVALVGDKDDKDEKGGACALDGGLCSEVSDGERRKRKCAARPPAVEQQLLTFGFRDWQRGAETDVSLSWSEESAF